MTGNNRRGYIGGVPKCYVRFGDEKRTNSASRVLDRLNIAKSIETITVIGEEYYINNELDCSNARKPLYLVSQRENATFADNILDAYNFLVGRLKEEHEIGVLSVFGDVPFRMPCTIDLFVHKIDENADLAIHLVKQEAIKRFYSIYRRPLVPVSEDGKLNWFKPDDMFYIKPTKFSYSDINELYQKRETSKFGFAIKTIRLISRKYPQLKGPLIKAFILRQIYRSLGISLPIFNGSLEKSRLEQIVKENPPYINAQIIPTDNPDGYFDIDNEADFRKLDKNLNFVSSELTRFLLYGN